LISAPVDDLTEDIFYFAADPLGEVFGLFLFM
jgi:hypothetical protein